MTKKRRPDEEHFLQQYDAKVFDRPNTTVDVVIFTMINRELHLLAVKRSEHPFKDHWSLVGGYIDIQNDSDLEATAKRKLEEKTGLRTPYLEQVETIGNGTRDPRGWSVTTVYFALVSSLNVELKAGTGAKDTQWLPVSKITEGLAFDHHEILKRCMERLRSKVLYTSLPVYLMPESFTLTELQQVYEVILGASIEPKSFRRRILGGEIVEETGDQKLSGKRPAKTYRMKKSLKPHFFVRTLEGAL